MLRARAKGCRSISDPTIGYSASPAARSWWPRTPIAASKLSERSAWSARPVSTMPASSPWSTIPPRSSDGCWAEGTRQMTQDMNDNAPSPATTPSESATDAAPEAKSEARIAALEAELAEAKDRLLRTLAESENQRRRAQRERDDTQRYAAANFAKDLLDVADNLGRALASVSVNDVQDERLKSLLEGVAATERALLAAFERNGIKRIEPRLGDRFDFNLHQAMFEVENSGRPAGAVVQVLQPGYQMHDRLLRPALVGVAKAEAAPPKDIPRVDTVV